MRGVLFNVLITWYTWLGLGCQGLRLMKQGAVDTMWLTGILLLCYSTLPTTNMRGGRPPTLYLLCSIVFLSWPSGHTCDTTTAKSSSLYSDILSALISGLYHACPSPVPSLSGCRGDWYQDPPTPAVVPTASAEITRPPRLHHCLTAARDTEDGAGGWWLLWWHIQIVHGTAIHQQWSGAAVWPDYGGELCWASLVLTSEHCLTRTSVTAQLSNSSALRPPTTTNTAPHHVSSHKVR